MGKGSACHNTAYGCTGVHVFEVAGRTERVGFYNTFVGRGGEPAPDGVTIDADPESGDIHLVRGPHYRGIQFHAESILTEHGYDLLHEIVGELLLPPPR